MEGIRMLHDEKCRHGTTEGEAFDSDLVAVDIRKFLEILRPLDKVLNFDLVQMLVDHVKTLSPVVAGSPAIKHTFDYAVV